MSWLQHFLNFATLFLVSYIAIMCVCRASINRILQLFQIKNICKSAVLISSNARLKHW